MRMHRKWTLMSAVVLAAFIAAPAFAAVNVTVSDQTAMPGQTGVQVPVSITSDQVPPNEVTDMAGVFQVGETANVDEDANDPVVVTGADLTGTIWETAPGGFTKTVPGAPNEAVPVNVSLNTSGEHVLADGLLYTAQLDVAATAPEGTYPLKVADTFGGDSAFQNSGNDVSASFTNGTLTIVPVPEPASLALLGVGGLALLGRRRRVA